jgi:hypothetical protein
LDQDAEEVKKMNHLLQRQLLEKDAELEAIKKELLKKEEQLQGKEKDLEALQVKMKKGCNNFSGFVCVFVLSMLFGLLFNVIKMA